MSERYTEGRKHGRRGARESHEPRLDARLFLNAAVAANTYVEWDGTGGITEWGMDCNGPDPANPGAYPDGLGDCGAAAVDHGNMAKATDAGLLGKLGQPVFAGTVAAYFAYGVSQGEAGTPPAPSDEPDQGVDNATWLAFLYKNGIIYGYGEVPVELMDGYAPKAHGLLVGQNLPDSAESDFEAHPPVPWGSAGEVPDGNEGHDTWYIAGHPDGSGEVITWGGLQPFTATYRRQFITDAWIIFDADDPEVDHAALQAALAAVHGTDTPPAPGPANGAPAQRESWIKRIRAWIARHLHRESSK